MARPDIPPCYTIVMPSLASKLHFGPGGVPLSTTVITDHDGKKYDLRRSALFRLEEMKLDHMEIEFVHGVNMQEEVARNIGYLAKDKGIDLTVHGPYYINLASIERPKYHASISRVQKTILAAYWLQAKSLTFHPGFYQGRSSEETSKIIETALFESITTDKFLKKTGPFLPLISIETTGKPSQWGSLDESIDMSAHLNEKLDAFTFSVCVDFAHIHARSNGEWNSYAEFIEILTKVENGLGKEALQHLHMHVSGINYTEKGEKNHMPFETGDFNYQELLKALKEKRVNGWLVCESPTLEDDAKLLQTEYNRIGS